MSYEKINTPIGLYKFMSGNINYGLLGKDNIEYTLEDNEKFQFACQNEWILSKPERLLDCKLGHCWDQVELERDWFNKHNYEFKTIFIWFLFEEENSYPTHTYLVYKENDKWNWFENADYENRGIHSFDSYHDAIVGQLKKYIDYVKQFNPINDEILDHIHIYEYDTPNYGCIMSEFIEHIINNANDITSEFKEDIHESINSKKSMG